jgi:PAS domain S-box-containing protein
VEKELHILILEDVATDAEMIERELQKGGIKFTSKRVETEGAFLSELKNFKPDLILADYKLPQFDGFSALAIVKEQCPDVPFILISGTLGEEEAVEALKAGATDYILKQKLSRLVPAVKRALREFEDRQERKIVREKLKESESLYRTIFETTGAATMIIEEDTIVSLTNLEGEKLTGYSKKEIEGKKSWTEIILKDDLDRMKEYHRIRRIDPDSAPKNYEAHMIDRQGNIKNVIVTASIIPGTRRSVASILDITKQKETEAELKESENKFKDFAEKSLVGIYLIQDRLFRYVNPIAAKIFEYTVEEIIDKKGPEDLTVPEDWPVLEESLRKRISGEIKEANYNFRGIKKNKGIIYLESHGAQTMYKGRPAVIGSLMDITERRKAEEEIQKRVKELEEFYRMAVGREMKMIELKEEIEKLNKELGGI